MSVVEDPYQLLGLEPGATPDQLRRARRRLAKELHPDAGGGHDAMAALNRAYERAAAAVPGPAPNEAVVSIERLPVDAFEVVRVAVAEWGDILVADEPYLLEGYLAEPRACFVRVEVVPEAGGSQLVFVVEPAEGVEPPSPHEVAALLTRAR